MTASLRYPALLLLGPTGAGKTPLGEMLQARGLWGRPCLHFDFGTNLRRIVERSWPDDRIGREDLDFLRQVLETGALLEDRHFPLAEKVLHAFLAETHAAPQTRVVLNGLPRHAGQAEAMDRIVAVETVVSLECPPETVLQRIRGNVGGDRTGRLDDDLESVREKLAIFARRTAPLVEYYRARGVRIIAIVVTATMTPDVAWQMLESLVSGL